MKTFTVLLLVATLLLHSCTCLDDDADQFPGSEEEDQASPAGAEAGQVNEHFSEQEQEDLVGGKTARQRLEDMPMEDAKNELRRLVIRVDLNGDGLLDQNELVDWLTRVEDSYFNQEAEEEWKLCDQNLDGFVTLLEFAQREFLDKDIVVKMEHIHSSQKRKFASADYNSDEKLSKEEFAGMLHPSRYEHMIEHLTDEHLRGFDKDKDGYITIAEYMTLFSRTANIDDLPEELEDEKREFEENLDKDGDGRLDREEVKRWAVPSLPGEHEYYIDEANHLIHVADKNQDGFLSADEISDEFQHFIDSPVTDFGHIRDEL